MQRESIRMYAYAIDFDLIKVDLSLNYYNGISSQFYLMNLDTCEVKILKGEAERRWIPVVSFAYRFFCRYKI